MFERGCESLGACKQSSITVGEPGEHGGESIARMNAEPARVGELTNDANAMSARVGADAATASATLVGLNDFGERVVAVP